MMCLVEIKRQKSIGVEVIEEMEAKVSALGRKRGVTLRTALVHSGELDPEVAAGGYFNAIVDVEEVLQQLLHNSPAELCIILRNVNLSSEG